LLKKWDLKIESLLEITHFDTLTRQVYIKGDNDKMVMAHIVKGCDLMGPPPEIHAAAAMWDAKL